MKNYIDKVRKKFPVAYYFVCILVFFWFMQWSFLLMNLQNTLANIAGLGLALMTIAYTAKQVFNILKEKFNEED